MGHNRLTPKQDKFANSVAYKEFQYAWEAYKAHYNCKRLSKNNIYVEACLLLQNPKVAQRIKEIEAEIVSKSHSTLDEILTVMAQRVRLDMRSYYKDDGTFLLPHEMTEEQALCINDFDTKTTWTTVEGERVPRTCITKVKLMDLKGLLDMWLKRFGAYAPKKIGLDEESLDHISDLLGNIDK